MKATKTFFFLFSEDRRRLELQWNQYVTSAKHRMTSGTIRLEVGSVLLTRFEELIDNKALFPMLKLHSTGFDEVFEISDLQAAQCCVASLDGYFRFLGRFSEERLVRCHVCKQYDVRIDIQEAKMDKPGNLDCGYLFSENGKNAKPIGRVVSSSVITCLINAGLKVPPTQKVEVVDDDRGWVLLKPDMTAASLIDSCGIEVEKRCFACNVPQKTYYKSSLDSRSRRLCLSAPIDENSIALTLEGFGDEERYDLNREMIVPGRLYGHLKTAKVRGFSGRPIMEARQ